MSLKHLHSAPQVEHKANALLLSSSTGRLKEFFWEPKLPIKRMILQYNKTHDKKKSMDVKWKVQARRIYCIVRQTSKETCMCKVTSLLEKGKTKAKQSIAGQVVL
jgi:hypothetical protein